MALNSLLCADVPLRTYTLTLSSSRLKLDTISCHCKIMNWNLINIINIVKLSLMILCSPYCVWHSGGGTRHGLGGLSPRKMSQPPPHRETDWSRMSSQSLLSKSVNSVCKLLQLCPWWGFCLLDTLGCSLQMKITDSSWLVLKLTITSHC